MAPDILFQNFSLMMDSPNSVQKMRKLILQMAVQGKLVPQDANDEPASELLKRIKAEKDRLIKEGKIKKTKPLLSIDVRDIPHGLPRSWMWTRMGEVSEVIMGQSPPGNTYNDIGEGVPLINGPVEFSNGSFGRTLKTKFTTKPTKLCKKDDLLLCVRGSTTGRTNIADFDGCIGRGVAAIRPYINKDYFNWYVVYARELIYSSGTGSTFPSVSYDKILNLLFPLPPLQEQKHIVEKVDQLMALCDKLEARQKRAVDKRTQLNDSTIDNLLATQDADEFADYWQLICENFDLLYNHPESVGTLRKAILQLAVKGKLEHQDGNDEPASELLKRIQAEKERLIKEKKIRKSKPLPPIYQSEVAYDIPDGWEWVYLDHISNVVHYGYTASADKNIRKVRLLRITDIQNGKVNWEQVPGCAINQAKFQLYELSVGDLLIARTGGTIGKTFLVEDLPVQAVFASYLIRVVPNINVSPNYVKVFVQSPLYWNQLHSKSSGTGQPNVNATSLKSLILPLPPIEEQKRIVEKVEQLMALCDDLQARLMQSQDDSGKLLDAVLYETLAA